MTFSPALLDLARQVLEASRERALKIATAESCTGGLIAGALTEIAGSSEVLERGLVTYSNAAKTDLLGVPKDLIKAHGAVSEEVARAMAEGALTHAPADLALACTGIAGPGGGSATKPVGLVHLALARTGAPTVHLERIYAGDRRAVRMATVEDGLRLLLSAV